MDPFIKLTTKLTNPKVSIEDKLKGICLTTASLIKGADRVSLWCFDRRFEFIKSLICYDAENCIFISEQVLKKSDFKEYFSSILQNETINAPQARSHEQTKCLDKDYLIPLEIHSLLDIILHQEFSPHGIICCESVGKVTQWSDDNVETLKRIARASSMYFFKADF